MNRWASAIELAYAYGFDLSGLFYSTGDAGFHARDGDIHAIAAAGLRRKRLSERTGFGVGEPHGSGLICKCDNNWSVRSHRSAGTAMRVASALNGGSGEGCEPGAVRARLATLRSEVLDQDPSAGTDAGR